MKQEKARAKALCNKFNLRYVLKGTEKSKNYYLDVFFSAKTPKYGAPFRAIVSEKGTWRRCVALYLQEKLNVLELNDHFLAKNSDAVLEFIWDNAVRGLEAFSVDVKDVYYSLPQYDLLTCVEKCIDQFGALRLSTTAGTSVEGFLELQTFTYSPCLFKKMVAHTCKSKEFV